MVPSYDRRFMLRVSGLMLVLPLRAVLTFHIGPRVAPAPLTTPRGAGCHGYRQIGLPHSTSKLWIEWSTDAAASSRTIRRRSARGLVTARS